MSLQEESGLPDKTEINNDSTSHKMEPNLITEKMEEKTVVKEKYPKIVGLIIANEFCERLSYYGFRTVLIIYFTSFLKLEDNTSTALYHAFVMLCYLTPILGAVLADGFIGLYKTIMSLSLVYAIGEIALTLFSMKPLGAPNLIGSIFGLILIGFGTGGIKPCVSAFGGNQFNPVTQTKEITTFFSIFYLSINVGSIIGTFFTPLLRTVKCFDNDCFPLAFGVPSILMLVAVVVFAVGTPFYKKDFVKGGKSIIFQTIGCVALSLKNKIKNSKFEKKAHWLDYAEGKYDKKMIADVKIFFKVSFCFLPLPLFWALFDQQGSTWTLQALQLNGKIGSFTIKPDAFQVVHPVLIVTLVPLFDIVVYPLFAKIGLFKKQLQRMATGLALCVLAFLVSAFLEYQMDMSIAKRNPSTQIKILNLSPCKFNMNYENDSNGKFEIIENESNNNEAQYFPKHFIEDLTNDNIKERMFEINGTCKINNKEFSISQNILNIDLISNNLNNNIANSLPISIIFYYDEFNNKMNISSFPYDLTKPNAGESGFKINDFNLKNSSLYKPVISNSILNYADIGINTMENSTYSEVDHNNYVFELFNEEGVALIKKSFVFETTSKYTILLFSKLSKDSNGTSIGYVFLTDYYSSGLHIFWQFFQIFVMSTSEVMFSLNGLAFAYAEAPQSMKSLITAVWLLTVAFGNFIVVIIAEFIAIRNKVIELLMYSGLQVIATVLFIVITYFYKYTNAEKIEEEVDMEILSKENDCQSKKSNKVAPADFYDNESNIESKMES